MSSLSQLNELDEQLLRSLAEPERLDYEALGPLLEIRARLLQAVIAEAVISEQEAAELVARSRRLKQAAEAVRRQLADTLATAQKGRRSTQAYAQVKQQE